ncbi:hypothetical protein K1719_002340 [Acacia pycnantha]|nr:hypothetical protein K1719_002340 [Acacia pycnantha]
MKPPISGDLFTTPSFFKICAFFFIIVTFFFLGKHWSELPTTCLLTTTSQEPIVATSPNYNNFFNTFALIGQNGTQSQPKKTLAAMPIVPPQAPTPAPRPLDLIRTYGILNENGTMSDDFEVGYFDPKMVDGWVNET